MMRHEEKPSAVFVGKTFPSGIDPDRVGTTDFIVWEGTFFQENNTKLQI